MGKLPVTVLAGWSAPDPSLPPDKLGRQGAHTAHRRYLVSREMKAQAKAREADQPISVRAARSSGSVTVVFGAQLHTTNLKQGKRCQLCGCKPRRRWSTRSAPLRGAPNPSPLAREQRKVPPQKRRSYSPSPSSSSSSSSPPSSSSSSTSLSASCSPFSSFSSTENRPAHR